MKSLNVLFAEEQPMEDPILMMFSVIAMTELYLNLGAKSAAVWEAVAVIQIVLIGVMIIPDAIIPRSVPLMTTKTTNTLKGSTPFAR